MKIAPQTSSRLSRPARRVRRGAALTAAVAAAALLAGCGASGSTPPASSATTPGAAFNPQLVPTGGSSPGRKFASETTKKSKKKASGHHASRSRSGGSSASSGGSGSSAGSSHTSGSGSSGGASGSSGASSGSSGGSGSGGGTVTVTHTITITNTRYIRPSVPDGAGLPSIHAALALTHFDTDHGNIGCEISGGTVRCDVGSRAWTAPKKPWSCQKAWGQGIFVSPSGSPQFVCAGDSVLDPTGAYVLPGYDDKVGSVTCQVRSFGVTCFEADGHGFTIGRTGYLMF